MSRIVHAFMRALAYTWAAPNTLVGALVAAVALAAGARLRVVDGVAEVSGGRVADLLRRRPRIGRFSAITLGHVILGVSADELDRVRTHEHVHVRQYERWGPLFLPAYAISSGWERARGRRAYRDNRFEREAYAERTDREWRS